MFDVRKTGRKKPRAGEVSVSKRGTYYEFKGKVNQGFTMFINRAALTVKAQNI